MSTNQLHHLLRALKGKKLHIYNLFSVYFNLFGAHKSQAMAELGESLNQFLTGLEDLGADGLPADMEIDLRHVMNLDSPSLASRFLDEDELDDDLLESLDPFGLSPDECSQMAQFFQRNLTEEREDFRFFPLDEDEFKVAAAGAEPFALLPNRLSLNIEGLLEDNSIGGDDPQKYD